VSVKTRSILLFPLLLLLALLPFFEGGETATGAFVLHSLILLLITVASLSGLRIPRFLVYFLPFLLVALLGVWKAPYHYSGALLFWDFCVAGLFVVSLFSIPGLDANSEPFGQISFIAMSCGLLISLFFAGSFHGTRLRGSFINPNDFGSFCLILFLFGIGFWESGSNRAIQWAFRILLVIVSICLGLASSRSAFLALFVVLVLYVKKRRSSRLVIATIALILVLGAAFLISRFFMHEMDPYRYYRLQIWGSLLKGLRHDPYLGLGLNMIQYYALQLNFPAIVGVGRYAKIPSSADSQYVQLLVETGFLGFLTFLVGWFGLYLSLKKLPERYYTSLLAFIAISVVGFFTLPIYNTSVLFLFLYVISLPLIRENTNDVVRVPSGPFFRIFFPLLTAAIFYVAVWIPYRSDSEFKEAIGSRDAQSAKSHLAEAVALNPYQPYYNFYFVNKLIDSHPNLTVSGWQGLVNLLDRCINLNPLEPDFYVYKAKSYRSLLALTGKVEFYTNVTASYEDAIQVSPVNPFLRGEFAEFLKQSGHYPQALDQIHTALKLEPAYINGYFLSAETYYRSGNVDQARAAFQAGLDTAKKYSTFNIGPGDIYSRKLLNVNDSYKERVQGLIFDGSKP
jgi:O-Antigen ligase/Tetratricopeptide repeat